MQSRIQYCVNNVLHISYYVWYQLNSVYEYAMSGVNYILCYACEHSDWLIRREVLYLRPSDWLPGKFYAISLAVTTNQSSVCALATNHI